jgi:hypothetical protein
MHMRHHPGDHELADLLPAGFGERGLPKAVRQFFSTIVSPASGRRWRGSRRRACRDEKVAPGRTDRCRT